jgi:hypothetical protein
MFPKYSMSSVACVPGGAGPPALNVTRRVSPLARRSRTSHSDTGTNGCGASALISCPRQSCACESTGDAPGVLTGAVKAAETCIVGKRRGGRGRCGRSGGGWVDGRLSSMSGLYIHFLGLRFMASWSGVGCSRRHGCPLVVVDGSALCNAARCVMPCFARGGLVRR